MSENHDPVVVEDATPESGGECPVTRGGRAHPTMGDANREWWPNKLNLKILAKNPAVANPLGEEFSYAAAFKTLDLPAYWAGVNAQLTASPAANNGVPVIAIGYPRDAVSQYLAYGAMYDASLAGPSARASSAGQPR